MLGTRIYWSTLLVATLFSACESGDDGEECAPLRAAIGEAGTLADETLAVFRTEFQAAIAEPPTAGTAACTFDVNSGLAMHRAVQADALGSFEPPKVRSVRGAIETAERQMSSCEHFPPETRQANLDELRAYMEELSTGHDLIVLEQSRVEPAVVSGTGTFAPGSLQARLLVWSYAESAFVCVAEASATSGSEVGLSRERLQSDMLNQDLDRRVALSGARDLRAVAP
jgi:hypothetical protein